MGPGQGRDLPDHLRPWHAGRADYPPAHPAPHTTFAELKRNDCPFDLLVELGGWTSPAMALRYGSWEVASRAEDAARALSLGDRL